MFDKGDTACIRCPPTGPRLYANLARGRVIMIYDYPSPVWAHSGPPVQNKAPLPVVHSPYGENELRGASPRRQIASVGRSNVPHEALYRHDAEAVQVRWAGRRNGHHTACGRRFPKSRTLPNRTARKSYSRSSCDIDLSAFVCFPRHNSQSHPPPNHRNRTHPRQNPEEENSRIRHRRDIPHHLPRIPLHLALLARKLLLGDPPEGLLDDLEAVPAAC
jgi:hypothetical protein